MQPAKSMSCPYCGDPLIGGSQWGLFKCANTLCTGYNRPLTIKPTQKARDARRR
jgi:hypothetical protein